MTVFHFGEHKRLYLESSKQNYYIISLRVIIKGIFTTIAMLERVNGTGTHSTDTGGALTMLGLCQFDDTGPATPKYTICPCLYRVTHAKKSVHIVV